MLAKGVECNPLMAEIFGKSTGTNRGKGGSMHVNDHKYGALGASAIVGSGIPLACGAAFASQYMGDDRVTCVFFGDGASNEGAFSESLNLASIWKLPVLFILENNSVAVTTVLDQVTISKDLYKRAKAYGVPSIQVNGQDIFEVFNKTTDFVAKIRSGNGPALIEANNLRFNEHQEGPAYARVADSGYRDKCKVKIWISEQDPIRLFADKLIMDKEISVSDVASLHADEVLRVDKAVEFALKSPEPNPNSAFTNIFSE
jgi:pyruvate dehydrogenase E1 component alpha subunit